MVSILFIIIIYRKMIRYYFEASLWDGLFVYLVPSLFRVNTNIINDTREEFKMRHDKLILHIIVKITLLLSVVIQSNIKFKFYKSTLHQFRYYILEGKQTKVNQRHYQTIIHLNH